MHFTVVITSRQDNWHFCWCLWQRIVNKLYIPYIQFMQYRTVTWQGKECGAQNLFKE
jgi:hypothetical protein